MMANPLTRRRIVLSGIVLVLVIVAATAWYRSTHRSPATPEQGAKAASGSDMAGMDMSTDGSVTVSPAQVSQFGITFGTVGRRTLINDVRTTGIVMIDEGRIASVTPKIGGFIERLYVKAAGQPVRIGQPLAEVYSADLVAAQEELLLARRLDRTVGDAVVPGVPSASGELLAAAKRRLRLLDVPDAQIEEVLRTGKVRRTVTLYSPATGIVVEKKVVLGQAIQAGMELYSVANLSDVWIDVQLREAEAGMVNVGTNAALELASYPGRIYRGAVAFIYPTVTEATRTIRARIVAPNTDGVLKPGMYATVHLTTPTRDALTVPRSAVIQTGARAIVFVDMGRGRLMPHAVTIGRVANDLTEVLTGLDAGQRVVTSAQFLIDSESNLGEVMRSMVGNGAGMQGSGSKATRVDETPDAADAKGADMRGMPGMTTPAPKPARKPR
ncbi:MAG: efflux RND transporter periplasmic adaptor subunit [Longimicrobiales bacterium]